MPNDLSVPRLGGPSPGAAGAAEPAATAPAPPGVSPPHRSFPNPTLRLDPALGIVVIEFRDSQGAVKSSIPTQHQLDAYRNWERTRTGPSPQAASGPAAPPGLPPVEV